MRTVDSYGNPGTWSPVRSLTVTAPTAPLPARWPVNDARVSFGSTVVFDWDDVPGANSYTLQIDDSNSFPSPYVLNTRVTGSTHATARCPRERCGGRPLAHAAGNGGAWSAMRRLEVK